MTLAAWLHDLSPFLVKFTDTFGLRWYGLAYAAGFAIAYVLMRWLARRGAIAISPERVGDTILLFVIGVVVGGRLGYALFYRPSLFWTFTADPPWWGLLAIHEGGMSSHGGILGVILMSYVVARGWKDERGVRHGAAHPYHIMDITAMLVPFGLLLGRLANFINAELLGKIVAMPGEPAPWWAVKFPQERLTDEAPALTADQSARLLEIVRPFAGPGEDPLYPAYERMLERIQAGDHALAADLAPLIAARVPSQLLQGLAEGVIVGAVVWWVARKPRVPGVVGCWFLISYGVLRVITEIWRLPDSHLAVPRIAGLSRGQWLSLVMVAFGAVMLWVVTRRGGPKVGGWAVDHHRQGPAGAG